MNSVHIKQSRHSSFLLFPQSHMLHISDIHITTKYVHIKSTTVEPVARFLSPARAPRGLHRALFMDSVSHGKIWTDNAASL